MFKETFRVFNTFQLDGCSLFCSSCTSVDADGCDRGQLGLAHLLERVRHPEVVVVHVFVTSLDQVLKICAGCSSCESRSISCQKIMLDVCPVALVDVGVVVESVPPEDGSITES